MLLHPPGPKTVIPWNFSQLTNPRTAIPRTPAHSSDPHTGISSFLLGSTAGSMLLMLLFPRDRCPFGQWPMATWCLGW